MSYKLHIPGRHSDGQVILTRSRLGGAILFLVLFAIGLALFLVGLAAFLGSETINPIACGLKGGGLIFICASFLLLTQIKPPSRFIFDNSRGQLVIEEPAKKHRIRKAMIPYSGIEGFRVHRKTSSSSGKGQSISYCADILKKDGAEWTLYQSGSKPKAESFVAELERAVDLNARTIDSQEVDDMGPFSVYESGEWTRIDWVEPLNITRTMLFWMIICGFGMAIYGFAAASSPIVFYLVSGFIGLIFLVSIYVSISSWNKVHHVEISSSQLHYFKSGGIFGKKGFRMPIHEISAVLFRFSLGSAQTALFILREEEVYSIRQMREGKLNMSDAFAMIRLAFGIKKIPATELSFAEKVKLEQLIQEIIEKRSGRMVG